MTGHRRARGRPKKAENRRAGQLSDYEENASKANTRGKQISAAAGYYAAVLDDVGQTNPVLADAATKRIIEELLARAASMPLAGRRKTP